jgi:hypothetical protein
LVSFRKKDAAMKKYLAVVACLSAFYPAAADAASCAPKGMIEEALGTRFGEVAFAMGVAVGNLVKFFSNPQSGSWTVVVVRPDGMACVVAQGESLEVDPQGIARPSRLAGLAF